MMAAFMLATCLTVSLVPMEESEAVSQGDAWGFSGTLDGDDIIKLLYEYSKDEPGDNWFLNEETGKPYTMAELCEKIKEDAKIIGLEITVLEPTIELDAHMVTEIVKATDTGYVLESDLAIAGTIGMNLDAKQIYPDIPWFDDLFEEIFGDDMDLPEFEIYETMVMNDVVLDISFIQKSMIYTNADFEMTGIESTEQFSYELTGSGNFTIIDGNEIVFDEDMRDVTGYFISDMKTVIQLDDRDSIPLLPNTDWDIWAGETRYDAHIRNEMTFNTSYPTFDDDFLDGVEVDFDTIEYLGTLDETGIGFDIYTLDMDDVSIIYSISGEPISNADTIRDRINDLANEGSAPAKDKDMVIKFFGEDDEPLGSITVPYGETIGDKFPQVPEFIIDDDGEKEYFVGWEYGNDMIWTGDMPVKSNMKLETEYAEYHEGGTAPVTPGHSGSTYWDALVDDLEDMTEEIKHALVNNGNVLYIDVKDANGNILYSWRMSNSPTHNISGTILMPQIIESEVPSKDYIDIEGKEAIYLDFSASGTMPSNTVVSYNVEGTFKDGTILGIYYDNGKELVHTATVEVKNGIADIPLYHCSSYVLMGESYGDNDDGGNMTLIIAGIIALLVIIVAAVIIIKKRGTSA